MLALQFTTKMKRDVKRLKKRDRDLAKLTVAINLLVSRNALPERYRDHQPGCQLSGFRECHLEPDWLLIYRLVEDQGLLIAAGTGSHADLFG